ncbi:hypothetical protein M5K25_021756 [Dendrobium thyrsiflorum]|uniref:RIC1 C-terminal alpha solenoid region domain-containing protein n=1 Tax=Dendrobium thyrsiflorum TaxID=117978 RepID=A0ABD0U4Y3_DENTH
MYMAYGWPQVIAVSNGVRSSDAGGIVDDRIIYLKIINRLLLLVTPTHLQLWSCSQHKVRIGKYVRDGDSVQREGENLQAIWSPDTKTIAVLTSSAFFHIYKVQFSGKRLLIGGKQPSGLFLANISLVITEKAPFSEKNWTTSNFVCDNKSILIGLSNGHLQLVTWNAEFSSYFEVCSHACSPNSLDATFHSLANIPSDRNRNACTPSSVPNSTGKSAIMQLEVSLLLRLLVVLNSHGQVTVCSISKKGLKQTDSIKAEWRLNTDDVMCTSIASEQQILAVGCSRGVVELYDLADSTSCLRTVSLYDWGYSMEDTGPVTCINWTPDNYAFAVGWKFRGLAVWSVSGCRLMCTIRQTGVSSAQSPMVKTNQEVRSEPLMGGTALLHWDEYGYKLYAVEESSSDKILAFSFGKYCLNRGLSGTTYIRQILYGEDRVLIVQSDDNDELKILHLNLPVSYISQNWPVLHVVASKDGTYLAVAGLHGLILYDLRHKRWRFFGDVTQEQKIECKGLLWMGKIIILCNFIDSSNTYELLFFPRYHLDQSSLLFRKPLLGKPIIMDVFQDYILITYRPFDVHIFHVKVSGELSPTSAPYLQLSTVRELSIMTAKSHPASMRFIPDLTIGGKLKDSLSSSNILGHQPSRCLILRTNGELSLLDLDDGHEQVLTNSVELFWVTCGHSEEKENLIEEVSWLDYGHRGMQVWYPSPGADPFKQEDFFQLDPELEFDREVYPLGLLPNAGIIVGVSQRMSFTAGTEFPCYEPCPQAQTILHCLLRHLLQRDKSEEALRLAYLSAEKHHFSHCLEWLLFTVFDAEISRQSSNKIHLSASTKSSSCSLLEKTCDLIKNFPEYLDVVVSVARKTDGRHWADLFTAAGRSTELFEECFQRRWYRTAACYILVIAKLEGPAVSQYCALRLLQATLDESLYELAGELVQFLLRSGREYESSASEADKSPRFLGYFLFGSSSRRQSNDWKSTSFKEPSAHVASVRNILEHHASFLMSGKELSKLVAFVKGTQFDLVDFLQRERLRCAHLDNFASGLELVGQKLQMGTLQSRLDAEFLLAHMCSVKFKEWIVILATLLRRMEVLFDLFRHDPRLWKAYSITLQSHPAFDEYLDLLDLLEEKLASVRDVDENQL